MAQANIPKSASTKFNVTKANGDVVPFSEEKLRDSLKRAGAKQDDINHIIYALEKEMYEKISTQVIYKNAFRLLKKISKPAAAKYSIKKAILELGPSGYPFERFVGQILHHHGYEISVGITLQGKCVTHEIDVLALKDNEHFMVECKFHNQMGRKCDVKIPLYINSRFLDVVDNWSKLPGHGDKFHQGWIVTNTRFTEDAEKYGVCAGLRLLSWDYPKKNNLRHFIDRASLHPITCLTTLSKADKQRIMDQGIVLCKELITDHEILNKLGISKRKISQVLKEAEMVIEA